MRTTLILNDDLVMEAKKRAASQGLTLSAVVEAALRGALQKNGAECLQEAQFSLPTYRPAKFVPHGLSPAEIYALQADDELSGFQP
mgnify:CR=1 FL=1